MQPSATLFKAARAMFKDIWDHRLATGAERTKALKAELGKVSQQVEQFLDRIADVTVPSVIAAYEMRIKALEERQIFLAEKIASTGRPVRSFDETLRTAFDFLASPCQLWASERLEDKRTVLKLAFADRLAYVRNEGFRTPNFSLPFKALGHFEGQEMRMASSTGIENQPENCMNAGFQV
jgi:site-specific DNA recombinase